VQVTKKGGTGGLESPDGKTFYYAKGLMARDLFRVRGLWKVPVEGGEETPVLKQLWADFFEAWGLTREGIYYYNDSTSAIQFFSFATHKITQIAKPEKRGGDLSVSPDGRFILFAQVDQDTSHIMMVENFRW
jgi:Tol biopolymer transport system component